MMLHGSLPRPVQGGTRDVKERETFASRLGFVLISAGCAIGLGNVWRFPYIVGQYGGAAFVLIYIVFLLIMGLPIMSMEFAVGRASRKSITMSFQQLEPRGTKWHWYGWFGMAGNYLLMMFYTTISGWLLLYFFKLASGQFEGMDTAQVSEAFITMRSQDVGIQLLFMVIVVVLGMLVCSRGLKNGVEKANKAMMLCLLALLVVLAVRAVTLPGAVEGLKFYLVPNFHNLMYDADGKFRLFEAIYAAMGQSFFTLSLGIGAMAIFGSYLGRERSLMGEVINITILDTCVAFVSGLIIFPACSAYGIESTSGPSLVFITLPNVFNHMPLGRFWGALFFLFMTFAAYSTVIAVFQNMISFATDLTGCSIKKAAWVNIVVVIVLSLPCVLGFNVLSGFAPFGDGSTIMDLEDFLTSNTLLPIGSLIYLLFCTSRYGWGFKKFMAEANEGTGSKFLAWARVYVTYVLPVIMIVLFAAGYWSKFVG